MGAYASLKAIATGLRHMPAEILQLGFQRWRLAQFIRDTESGMASSVETKICFGTVKRAKPFWASSLPAVIVTLIGLSPASLKMSPTARPTPGLVNNQFGGEAPRNDVGRKCRRVRVDEFELVFFGEPGGA